MNKRKQENNTIFNVNLFVFLTFPYIHVVQHASGKYWFKILEVIAQFMAKFKYKF